MLWRNREGTRTLEASASQYWFMIGNGWILLSSSDPIPAPPNRAVVDVSIIGDALWVGYTDGTTALLDLPDAGPGGGPIGGGQTGIALDVDGAPYIASASASGIAVDTDGTPYISSYVTGGGGGSTSGIAVDTDGVAFVTAGGSRTVALDTDGVAYVAA